MWLAVLLRAIADYTDKKASDFHRWNASRWLFSHSRAVGSLWWICIVLSSGDADHLRERLLNEIKMMKDKPKSVMFRVDR